VDVKNNHFETLFRVVSYALVFCGLMALLVSGGAGFLSSVLFICVLLLAWFLEGSKWQISERMGVVVIILTLPLFYLDWKFQISGFNTRGDLASGSLSRLILILAGIKLLQRKTDRDWIFLYIISFFMVLLAAGMSLSLLFIIVFAAYLLFAATAIVAFEIRKSSESVFLKSTKTNSHNRGFSANKNIKLASIPVNGFILLILIATLAAPLFFLLPRVGGAGFGKNLQGLTGFSGFSEFVRLGDIGKLQLSDEVVMRVRIEDEQKDRINDFHWRGVALDFFDNKSWLKSRASYAESFVKTERDFFLVDAARNAENLVAQTVYLEPIDTSVLFSLPRPVALQGNFSLLNKDAEGGILLPRTKNERTTYKVFSDVTQPSDERLEADTEPYGEKFKRYLQLPENLDPRIGELTRQVFEEAGSDNRFRQSRAVENYLQNNFGYTLEMKAGGDEPLADFLFNVREGHCEYFATAMAVMLRTQGIATRVVNGFQAGDYNETAGVYVVRQKNAHAWVEVYFPGEKAWIAFDPTPAAGQFSGSNSITALDRINNYLEALETFWVQYVISYDNQGQRSLFRSVRNAFKEFQDETGDWLKQTEENLSEWWKEARGDNGLAGSARAVGFGIVYLIAAICGGIFIVWLYKKIPVSGLWLRFKSYLAPEPELSVVEFYERMLNILESKGVRRQTHQTPLEFARSVALPQAVKITENYNRVRFGEKDLSPKEKKDIENWLATLEQLPAQQK
jgi:protein-glutamine gamma-glutamyltransferase